MWSESWLFTHPGSRIPDPGVKRHVIPDRDPQHWDPDSQHFESWLMNTVDQEPEYCGCSGQWRHSVLAPASGLALHGICHQVPYNNMYNYNVSTPDKSYNIIFQVHNKLPLSPGTVGRPPVVVMQSTYFSLSYLGLYHSFHLISYGRMAILSWSIIYLIWPHPRIPDVLLFICSKSRNQESILATQNSSALLWQHGLLEGLWKWEEKPSLIWNLLLN